MMIRRPSVRGASSMNNNMLSFLLLQLLSSTTVVVSAAAAANNNFSPSTTSLFGIVQRIARKRRDEMISSSSSASFGSDDENYKESSIFERKSPFSSSILEQISQQHGPLSSSPHRVASSSSASASASASLSLSLSSSSKQARRRSSTQLAAATLLLERLRGGGGGATVDVTAASTSDADEDNTGTGSSSSSVTEKSSDTDTANSATANNNNNEAAAQPVSLTVQTITDNVVVDASLEITVLSTRTVAAIKERLRRVIPGKPPLSTISLLHQGHALDNEQQTIQEILQDMAEDDDDDDEEEDETDKSNDDSNSNTRSIVLTLNMLPPVDPKFVTQLEEKMQNLTTSQLLDAYAMNEAILYQNHIALSRLQEQQQAAAQEQKNDDDNTEKESDESSLSASQQQQQRTDTRPIHVQLQQDATRIRQDLELLLLQKSNNKVMELLADIETPSTKARLQAANPIQQRGQRIRHSNTIISTSTTSSSSTSSTSSSYISLRRIIQTNLNIHWGDTIRYFILFIFFGYFGGRTPTSRAILLLGAPSVFLIQARPVKLLLKQILYTIFDHPYSIILSLLPAPQQTILNLNYNNAMEIIYGIIPTKTRMGGKRRRTILLEKDDYELDQEHEQFLDKMDDDDEEFFDVREQEDENDDDDDDNE